MQIKFKKLRKDAVPPKRSTSGAAGFDLTVNSIDYSYEFVKCYSGIAMEIPPGYVGLLFPRSSICDRALRLSDSVGVIDSDYRGELTAVFDIQRDNWSWLNDIFPIRRSFYKIGERFAQLVIVPVPEVEYVEADELSATERGAGGYGSTGK